MDSKINVFVKHNGRWDEKNFYVGFTMTGVLVDTRCTYREMVKLLVEKIFLEPPKHNIAVEYQTREGSPRIRILSDYDVLFYLELKKKDKDLTSFPLCVTEDKELELMDTRFGISNEASNNMSTTKKTLDHEKHTETMALGLLIGNTEERATTTKLLGSELDDEESSSPSNFGDTIDRGNSPRRRMKRLDEILDTKEVQPVIEKETTCIAVEQVFKNKDILSKSLRMIAINNKFQYKTKRSCQERLVLTCIDPSCEWYIRARRIKNSDLFIVKKYVDNHNCSLDVVVGEHRQASSQAIGDCIKSKYMNPGNTCYRPNDIIRDMKDDYGISVNYNKAWRAREHALEAVRGAPNESYQKLPSFLYRLKIQNPGSVTDLETDCKHHFKYLFMALGASISGWEHCRPVIAIDGSFLKTKYEGTLFTACALDANEQIFPLAFGVGDLENDSSWEWFLTRFKHAYGDREGLCIVSDRHKSIEKAVRKIYPDASYGFCMYHLHQNLKKKFPTVAGLLHHAFHGAARSYIVEDFEYYMKQLDELHRGIRPYLEEVGYERWSRAFFEKRRYSIMTSNIAESMNSVDVEARNLPIHALLDWLRELLQKWFYERRNKAAATMTKLASAQEEILWKYFRESSTMKVIFSISKQSVLVAQKVTVW